MRGGAASREAGTDHVPDVADPVTGPQAAGNQAVQRLFRAGAIQAKLSISQPNDPYEQEADRIADQVMRMPESSVQRQCAACAPDAPCPKCEEGKIGRKVTSGHSLDLPSGVSSAIASRQGGGQPLPASTRAFFEPRFATDFSEVRLHTDSEAAQFNRAINALAFTYGQDIYLGDGKNNFESGTGKQLLAHELTHVVQQGGQAGSQLRRTCAQSSDESVYQAADNYCKDSRFSGILHPGQRCYREVPRRSSYFDCPPGDQVCFDEEGKCHDSYDRASTVESRNRDGTCNLHGLCFIKHAALDIIPGFFKEGANEQARELMECKHSCEKLEGLSKTLCETECNRSSRLL